MAWYFRQSVRLGPVRFNFSKSGIGTSVGVKGFRVGIRPNGTSYLHAGAYGIYYREELGKSGRNRERGRTSQIVTVQSTPAATVEFTVAGSQELKPPSRKELLDKLNQSYGAVRLDYLCGAAFVGVSFIACCFSSLAGSVVLAIGIAIFLFVAKWESQRRTISIAYDFEDNQGSHFQKLVTTFNTLASSHKVWSLIDSRNIYRTHESKLNAGAANLINRTEAHVGEGLPPWVETNIAVPMIKTRGQSLYMMPDGILVYDERGVGFIEYADITVDAATTRFIEESPPPDAVIVANTWKHPNGNGGPDRRFKVNYQIPICLYGELTLKSQGGMHLYLMTSMKDAAQLFSSQFVAFRRQPQRR